MPDSLSREDEDMERLNDLAETLLDRVLEQLAGDASRYETVAFIEKQLAALSPPIGEDERVKPDPVAWRWRCLHPGRVNYWRVRQSPISPQPPRPGFVGIEVEPLYTAAGIDALSSPRAQPGPASSLQVKQSEGGGASAR